MRQQLDVISDEPKAQAEVCQWPKDFAGHQRLSRNGSFTILGDVAQGVSFCPDFIDVVVQAQR